MVTLTHFDRHYIVLHQHEDHLNTIFIDSVRLLYSTVSERIQTGNDAKRLMRMRKMNILGEFELDVLDALLVVHVGILELPEQLLIGQRAVIQVRHYGRPALVLQVFVVDQALAEGAKLLGNFKHFLPGKRDRVRSATVSM